jgi:FixJ family two-component response regulator
MAWSPETTSSRRNALLLRDEAVRKALATGIPAQQIAEALGVRPEDVDRMAQRPQPV